MRQDVIKNIRVTAYHGTSRRTQSGLPFLTFEVSDVENGGFFFTDNKSMACSYIYDEHIIDVSNVYGQLKAIAAPMVLSEHRYNHHQEEWYDYVVYESDWADSAHRFKRYRDALEFAIEMVKDRSGYLYTVELEIQNPKVIDAKGDNWNDITFGLDKITTRQFVAAAYHGGFDGVIIKNVVDYGKYMDITTPSDVYVVFHDDQIHIKMEEEK